MRTRAGRRTTERQGRSVGRSDGLGAGVPHSPIPLSIIPPFPHSPLPPFRLSLFPIPPSHPTPSSNKQSSKTCQQTHDDQSLMHSVDLGSMTPVLPLPPSRLLSIANPCSYMFYPSAPIPSPSTSSPDCALRGMSGSRVGSGQPGHRSCTHQLLHLSTPYPCSTAALP